MNLLETTKLVKTYGGRTVVDQVSFVLAQQEIVGILGRNGAGKTTTFRMIMGMIRPDSGAVAFYAYDITHLPMYKRARRGIGYLSQERSDFRRLTVWQNLQAILETLNITRHERSKRAPMPVTVASRAAISVVGPLVLVSSVKIGVCSSRFLTETGSRTRVSCCW